MSINASSGSRSSLVHSGDSEPQPKKIRLRTDKSERQNKSPLFSLVKWRKNRKVGNETDTAVDYSKKTQRNGTFMSPTSNSSLHNNNHERHEASPTIDRKHTQPASKKSLFSKTETKLNVNRSESTKLLYFGFLLPALALHPKSLEECDAPKYDEDFKLRLAAAHINDAINSRGKFGRARSLMKSDYVQRCYKIISSPYWEYLIYLFIALHCFMAFWEQSPTPTAIRQQWLGDWVMNASVLVIDALCTMIYIIDIILWIGFLSWSHFWSAKENFWIRVEFVFTAMFIVDYVILVLQRALGERLIAPFRCLRAAMLLCKSKNVSHIFKVLLSIMSRLGKVFAIILIFIFTFASIGLHLYMLDYHEVSQDCPDPNQTNCTSVYSGAFDNIAIASVHMFVLMSTENYPDIIIPAFFKSTANFFYFMFYLYAGVFFLTAILLAIIVESYWEYSKKHVKMERLRQREELIRAWNLLDLNGTGYLSVYDPKLLKLFALLKPKNTEDQITQLIEYMSEGNEDIDTYDWTTRLVQTLSIEFENETNDDMSSNDSVGFSRLRSCCSKIIHANGIGMAILVLILLHSIFFCLMWSGINNNTQLAFQATRTVIVFAFVVELVLRISADGAKLLNILDILDISMIVIAVAGNFTWYILWFGTTIQNLQLYLGACVVTSSLAVIARLLFNSEQARSAVHILRNIYPVMFDLILLVVIIIYFYAILGLEIFQDNTLEKSNAQGFEGSYVQYGCGVGFQTFGCALMIVFQIVTTNDWHQIMLGAMIDAGWASAFYFISCFLIIDMIVMNLFVAISIEAYKKLARDDKAITTKSETTPDFESMDESLPDGESVASNNMAAGSRMSKEKSERSLGEAAKDAFTGIFASTRARKFSNPPTVPNTAGMQFGRTGPRGSIAITSVHTDTSDDNDSVDDTILSLGRLSGSQRSRNRNFRLSSDSSSSRKRGSLPDGAWPSQPSSEQTVPRAGPGMDRREKFKARSERLKRERKEKQKKLQQVEEEATSANTLNVPSPKLSISDVVKLKRVVKILKPYDAKTSAEMNVKEGQTFYVSETMGDMYHGPNGWFPKKVALDIGMQASDDPFTEDMNAPVKKKKSVKFVNFQVENEVLPKDPGTPPMGRASPLPGSQLPHRPSVGRMRMKKDGNTWRRDIHGEMTVMNKQEAQELAKRLRGGKMNYERHQSKLNLMKSNVSRLSLLNTRRSNDEISQQIIEEREEESTPPLPILKVSEPQSSSEPSVASNDDTYASTQNNDTLTVPKSSGRNKAKPKGNGEIPGWLKNFVASNGVEVQDDLKFDESKLKSPAASDDDEYNEILDGSKNPSTSSPMETSPVQVDPANDQDNDSGTASNGLKRNTSVDRMSVHDIDEDNVNSLNSVT